MKVILTLLILFSLYLSCRSLSLKINPCASGCEECDTKNSSCKKCREGFQHYLGRCFNKKQIEKFILSSLDENVNVPIGSKHTSSSNHDHVGKNAPNHKVKELSHLLKKPKEDLDRVYVELNRSIRKLQTFNQRNGQRRINEFVLNFKENMNVLISLSMLFEQKSLFEVEKIKDKILYLLNVDGIDPGVKFNIIAEKLVTLSKLINQMFHDIKAKIGNYERVAEAKIKRAKENFFDNYRKFLKK